MKRESGPPICGDCFKLHRRLIATERVERRAALESTLQAMRAKSEGRTYALALFDHLTLSAKARGANLGAHPAPAVPSDWSGAQLSLADRVVLSTLHPQEATK